MRDNANHSGFTKANFRSDDGDLHHTYSSQQIDELLDFEHLLSEISATYINLPAGEVDDAIKHGLSRIGLFLHADRCSLWQASNGEIIFHSTHVWYKECGDSSSPAPLPKPERFQYAFDKWLHGEAFQITDPDDMPEEGALARELLIEMEVKSHLSVPFSVGGAVSGAIVLMTVKDYRVWPEKLITRLKLLGEIFANALIRKKKELELIRTYKEIAQLKKEIEADNIYLREEIRMTHNFDEIIGQSNPLRKALSKIEKVAPLDTVVLILGETGTGKELAARAIHNLSLRKHRPLIKVNCAALLPNLIENELFGHEKGAYTDARTCQVGRFELANNGTIFLDEIGELSLDLQPKLLRVLQDGEFERLGGNKTIKTDVRVIAATNADLQQRVEEGRFRQDLWYRLNIFSIILPPLREREDDIEILTRWFVKKYSAKFGKKIESIPIKTMQKLRSYPWPGNIRELEHVIERALITTEGPALQLMDHFNDDHADKKPKESCRTLEAVERDHILEILRETKGRIHGPKGAAMILNIHPSTLRFRMKRLGISKETVFSSSA